MEAELKDGLEAASGLVETGLAAIGLSQNQIRPLLGLLPEPPQVAFHLLPTVAGSSVGTASMILSHPEMYTPDDLSCPRP